MVLLAVIVFCIGAASRIAAADLLDPTAPSASFTVSPDSPLSGQTVTLTSTSSPGLLGAPIQSENWDLNNDGVFDDATGSQVQHVFETPGTYTVGLRVTDSNNATADATANIVVQNRLPSADFSASPSSPSTLQNVTFTSTSTDPDGSIASYAWDTDNDGNFDNGTGASVSRSFPFAGTYTVKLEVSDNNGGSSIATKTIDVGNQDPVASFEYAPSSPSTGDPITFTSTSTDPDGTIASYAWDLNNDGTFNDGTGASAQTSFATPGNHTVKLEVTDNNGATNIASLLVSVANRGPSASIDYSPAAPKSGDQITFTSTSTDPDGSIASYAWDTDNDGNFDNGSSSTVKTSFATHGQHTVKLRVTDNNGASDTASVTVDVGNLPPTASFGFAPSSPSTGDQITFTSSSSDSDGSIASYSWDLNGDNQFGDSTSSSAQTSFATPGSHTVKLQVTDDSGATDVATQIVNVGNRAPTAAFNYSPASPKSNDQITFTSTSTDPDGTIASYAWDTNNDGQFDNGSASSAQATFSTPGAHIVKLRVTDDNGATDTTQLTVQVANLLPTAGFSVSPQNPKTGDPITFTSTSTDTDGTIASYAWDLNNDGLFNDGTGASAQTTFTTPGSHTVKLRVTDNSGGSALATVAVDVANRAPTASFTSSPASPQTGDQVTFTSTSTDPDGSIASYSWDLNGDNQFGDSASSSAQTSFATPGNHTVKLQVTDNNGATDVATATVTIGNRAPTAAFNYSPASPKSNDQITFTSTSTDPDGTISSYAWDLDNNGQFNDGAGATAQTSFSTPGAHIVKLRVTDNNGATDTTQLTVQVANLLPTAGFSVSPQNPKTGDPVTFTSTSTDTDGTIASYAWDLNNDGTFNDGTGSSSQTSFANPGSHTVKLRVTDNSGGSAVATVAVDVANRPPAASFTSSPASPKTGDQVTFTSNSTDPDGTIASLAWDFNDDGDFSDGAGTQAQTSFALPGTHTVKLLVVDNNGASSIATGTVTIANRPPVASFTFAPPAPKTGEQITFTSTSTDPDGTIASYAWDLNNDGTFNDGTGSSAQTSFATPGNHTVKLKVTDNNGATATATVVVSAANRPPVAAFTVSPAAPKTGEQITFTSTSTDPDGTIASYAWDTNNDGTFNDGTSSTATKTFATAGAYTVKLKVTDSNGATDIATVVVNVANRPPVASFTVSPAAPKTGDPVTFSSTSTDPDGTIASYAWDLNNDGTFNDGTGSSAQTTFATPGAHTVKLRVTDNNGATDTATVVVNAANRPPVASFDISPTTPKTLEQVTFTSTSTDPDGQIASYAWDLNNDGTFNDGTGSSAQRSFQVTGTYTIKLRVTDNNGATDTITKTVTPQNQPPKAAFTTSPAAPTTDGPVTFTSTSTDPEGLPLTTSWDLNNDGTFETTGATATKQYTIPASYPFKVKVVDASGASDVASGTITIPNRPPTATIDHLPKNPQTGQAITFTATYSDPEQRIKAISWDGNDDGKFDDGTGPTLTNTYRKPSAFPGYKVSFKVEDLDGSSYIATDNVAVGNQPPKSSFVVLPASPVAGSTFTLVSTAIDPDTPLSNWLWDLNGDGKYGDATGPEVKYTFPAAGTYQVGLEVVDSEDVTDFAVQPVVVQAPPAPTAPLVAPSVTGPRLLTPFPVVRLAGRISRAGTRLRLFAIDAPNGARVLVTCKGRSCPFRLTARSAGSGDTGKGKVHASSTLRIRQLEKKLLKSGVSISIYVTKPGTIGKYVQFKIRKGRPPARIDRCLMPSAPNKPVECPS